MERQAVIFDVDGVLVDSYHPHFRSWEALGREHDVTFDEATFAASFGRTTREVLRAHWPGLDGADVDDRVAQLDDRKERLYREIIAADFPAMPGAVALIDALRAAGVPLAVGSSGPRENVVLVLERLGRADAFDAVVTGSDVTRGKPDPQIFQLAAARLGVEPALCTVVEDAAPGVIAAKRAGMRVVALLSTGHDRAELEEVEPDAIVTALSEVEIPGRSSGAHASRTPKRSAGVGTLLLACLVGCTPAATDDRSGDGADVGTAVYVGDDMIRDYRPEPALVVPATEVRQARFPAVDVHCHWSIDADPVAMLRAMDERNVAAAVNLSGGWGDDLDAMLERFHAFAPHRLLILCNIDFSRIDEPDFGASMAAELEAARAKGVSGLKIFKSLGLTTRDRAGRLVPVDDPRLDPVWAACGRLGLPVLIHSGDPPPFFDPIDERNERWMQLRRHPDWSFHGDAFPDLASVLEQRDRMIERHPRTTFICAHLASHASDLAALERFLDMHPNAYVDISGRVAEMGRQPYTARRFLLAYQDRVLFGTDRFPGRPDQPRYRTYFRFLETFDEYFEYHEHAFPPTGEWRIYGVSLPDDVLRKIYRTNADRVLGRG